MSPGKFSNGLSVVRLPSDRRHLSANCLNGVPTKTVEVTIPTGVRYCLGNKRNPMWPRQVSYRTDHLYPIAVKCAPAVIPVKGSLQYLQQLHVVSCVKICTQFTWPAVFIRNKTLLGLRFPENLSTRLHRV
jgi:hypothetical protein